MKAYKVGGCVRDRLLSKNPKDTDWVVVGSTPEEMKKKGFVQVGESFPVFLHPKTREEYALARTEKKTGTGHTGFETNHSPDVTLREDLSRRDLTINAIAEDSDGTIYDFNDGVADINSRTLRHVGPRFSEDPLRVLRVARFAAQLPGFTVSGPTLSLMREIYMRGELQDLTPERVWKECEKALTGSDPWRFFEVLWRCRADSHVFPEFQRLWGVPQPEAHHPEGSVDKHMKLVMDIICRMTSDPIIRFGALCHDLGKGTTPRNSWPQHIDHEKRGVEVINQMCKRLKIPNEYRDFARTCSKHHLRFHKILEMNPGKVVKLLTSLKFRHGPNYGINEFVKVCLADARGRKDTDPRCEANNRKYLIDCAFAAGVVKARTHDREGNPIEGKQVGELLHQDMAEAISKINK